MTVLVYACYPSTMININLKILDDKLYGHPNDKPPYPLLKSRGDINKRVNKMDLSPRVLYFMSNCRCIFPYCFLDSQKYGTFSLVYYTI